MTASKDTASFFENGTTQQFEYCYQLYPQVLKLKAEKRGKKPKELIRLDDWYQNELPKVLSARGKDAHMVYDELVQTMKWKQMRDKFYPQLSYLIKVNTPRAVVQETKKAFRKLPNLEQAITALSNLKGVGPTMASALLAAAAPDLAPFMAYECLMAIPDIEGIDYTTKEYLNFVQHIQNTVARLNAQAGGLIQVWSPHRVELALWSHYVANDLSPELLDKMPGSEKSSNTNGNLSKTSPSKVMSDGTSTGAGDDTNDGDEEMTNTNANVIESEIDNDNTNSISGVVSQDGGDSNFISNDSTSHEAPGNLDDNTTQTTATTTSTDDGGGDGTPLVSDSESNLEAPSQATKLHNNSTLSSTNTADITSTDTPTSVTKPTTLETIESKHEFKKNGNSSTVDDTSSVLVGNGNNGNGNGTLSMQGDSMDGEYSSSNNVIDDEEIDEEDDEDDVEDDDDIDDDDDEENDHIADDSSNSNSNIISGHKSINDSTLSNVGNGTKNCIQKRSLACVGNAITDDVNSQPDIKKIRSD